MELAAALVFCATFSPFCSKSSCDATMRAKFYPVWGRRAYLFGATDVGFIGFGGSFEAVLIGRLGGLIRWCLRLLLILTLTLTLRRESGLAFGRTGGAFGDDVGGDGDGVGFVSDGHGVLRDAFDHETLELRPCLLSIPVYKNVGNLISCLG